MSPLAEDIDNFVQHLAAERLLSAHTCKAYRRDLLLLHDFLQSQSLGGWQLLNPHHMRVFVGRLRRQGLSGRSIQRALSSTRSFYRYLIERKKVSANPAEGVPAPKSAKRLPSVLSVDEMQGLLNISDNDPLAVRDLAMMELMYSSGLRLSELVGLDMSGFNQAEQSVRVLGKGSKQRDVPVGSYALAALKKWLQVRADWIQQDEQAVFISQRGTRLSVRNVQQRLRQWGIKQGSNGTVHPHRLRHSFASHMLESSGDIRAVQELLGHANLGTTQIYTHLDFQHLAQVYDQAHPRARSKKSKA